MICETDDKYHLKYIHSGKIRNYELMCVCHLKNNGYLGKLE
jgi:hypothetical protein